MRRWTAREVKLAPKKYYWNPKDDMLLGTMPDRELAKLLGCQLTSVWIRKIAKRVNRAGFCAQSRREATAYKWRLAV